MEEDGAFNETSARKCVCKRGDELALKDQVVFMNLCTT
jgi:hypothetical protein